MIQPVTCPLCAKPLPPTASESASFPFCSRQCKVIDLARWLDGKYTVVENLDPDQLPLELLDPDDIPPDA